MVVAVRFAIHGSVAPNHLAAEKACPYCRQDPDLQRRERVRLIHIEGVAPIPCSGTPVADTGELGLSSIGAARHTGSVRPCVS